MFRNLLKRVNDVYQNWTGSNNEGGFFYFLNYYATTNEIDIPFLTNIGVLDLEYHGNFSGSKIVSPLIDNWYDEETFNAQAVKIAEMFWKLEGERLLRLYNTYTSEYNPTENYNIHYLGTDDHDGSDTNTKTGSERSENYGTVTAERGIQGFDSSSYTDADKTTTTYGNTSQDPLTNKTTYDDVQNELSYDSTLTREYTKSGNIGVKTVQEMLREEFQLWEWNFYYKCLFPAVDKLITIPIF